MPLARLGARLRSWWRDLRHRADVEAEMADEFRHHLELRTRDLIRTGLPPHDAARRARIEFGHVDSHRADARTARGLAWLDEIRFSALDVKLGLRMMRKHPGLSAIALVGMSIAIAIGAGAFGFIDSMLDPTLPLDEGERVVSIQNANLENPGNPDRQALHDFVTWREEVRSIDDLGAFVDEQHNLIVPGGGVTLVWVAEMTASGFRVARVPPVLGRTLLDDDERPGAPPVLVIAAEEWRRQFDGDPDIIGRVVWLGGESYTVVGVMPDGFRFPINNRYWVPFRLNPDDYERGGGPALHIVGRLADGYTLAQAQTELSAIGLRTAAQFPDTHRHLRPRVLRYSHPFFDVDSPMIAWLLRGAQLAIGLLLVVIAVNVAVLVYARTAMRIGEISVRTALGASRRRVVAQLFAEALVLSGTAAALGLTLAGIALGRIEAYWANGPVAGELPFWWELDLSPALIAYVAGLAIVGALIVGVVPALKATGRNVQANLQQLSSRGSGLQLGRTWTTLIVVQVAIAVAVLPFATWSAGNAIHRATAKPDYAVDEFLRARLSMEREEVPPSAIAAAYDSAVGARFRDRAASLVRRLQAAPEVAGVTFGIQFPGAGPYGQVEVERTASVTRDASGDVDGDAFTGGWVRDNPVDIHLLDVFGVPTIGGRGFVRGDLLEGANAIVVDRVFVERFTPDGAVLGRRVRFLTRSPGAGHMEPGPWLEIVGVVPHFTVQTDFDVTDPQVYRPLDLAAVPTALTLAVRVRGGTAASFAPRLREIAAQVDPALQLHRLQTAAEAQRGAQLALLALALLIGGVTASVILLSAAGIYAMMSFTIARRRREIAIRSALGADPRRLLTGIFARATAQLGAGVLVGLLLAASLSEPLGLQGLILLPAVAMFFVIVGGLAALGPARRGLSIGPTEALRDE